MRHGIPESNPMIGAVILVTFSLLVLVGGAVAAYYAFGECTRVHPVWYCLVR